PYAIFFFSSRRRHTRSKRDWSSDVCSSDLNAWLRIGEDESVLVIVDRSEMGQGVTTALPMLLAEELEADWSRIRIEFAPADKARSEERRVGKECRTRGWLVLLKKRE